MQMLYHKCQLICTSIFSCFLLSRGRHWDRQQYRLCW